jgi:hypothetical protein
MQGKADLAFHSDTWDARSFALVARLARIPTLLLAQASIRRRSPVISGRVMVVC